MICNLLQTLLGIALTGWLLTVPLLISAGWTEELHEALVTWAEVSVLLHAGAVLFETRILMWLMRRKAHQKDRLGAAQAAVQDVIDAKFANWALTPAELDVAAFLVMGMSTAKITALRGSPTGTVKAQLNAIYRKSGTGNRVELMSLLIDTMMGQRQPAAGQDSAARSA